MGELEREVRRLRRQISQADRRQASAELRGPVAKVDNDKRLCRVEICRTADDKPVLSPWVSWAEPSNGFVSVHTPMQVGDLVAVRSPAGVLGTASIAERLAYSGEKPAPANAGDASVEKIGDVVITRKADSLSLAVGGTSWSFSAAGMEQTGGTIKHDKVSIDKDHQHTKVLMGTDLSGPPKEQ